MSTRKLVSASFANLLIPISGLLVSPFLSRELGPDGRGLYAALTLPIVVCGWIGTYGLQDALSYHLRTGRLSRRTAAKVSLVASVPLGLLGIGLLAVLGRFVFPGGDGHYGQFLLLSLLAPLHILANLLIGALTGASDIRGVNLVKVVPALLRTALVVFACLTLDLGAYWAGLLFVASVSGGLVLGLVRLRSAPERVDSPGEGTGDPPEPPDGTIPARSLLAYSLTCLPGVLAAISSARLDQIVGLPVIGARELGYYAVAVSVAEIPMVIATAARTVLMGRPGSDDRRRGSAVARLAVLASTVASGVLAAIAGVAVPWVFGAAFAPAVVPTVILCAATTLYTSMVIFSAVLLSNGRAAWSSGALVAGSVLGIVLLFLLAPMGAVGAAIASLAGYGVSVVAAGAMVRRVPELPSLRELTVPYREDLRSFGGLAAGFVGRFRRRATADPGPADPGRADSGRAGASLADPAGPPGPATSLRWSVGTLAHRIDIGTFGTGLLFVLAWLRLMVPMLIQLFDSGRPEFNSRQDLVPPVSDLLGNALSLAFILVAAVLAAHGGYRHRPARLWSLAAVLAPFVAIEAAGLLNHQRPGLVSLALPLAAVAIWLQPVRREVLGVIGILGAATATGSILLALVRPDLALISGTAAGDKSGLLGGLLAGPFLHSNVLGIALALSIPFVFCVGHPLIRRGGLVVLLFALFWTGSRSSQLAVAAVLFTYLLIRLFPTRIWMLWTMMTAGVAAVVFVPLLTTDPEAFTRRGRIWHTLLDQWAEHPLLGYGPRYFQREPDLAVELGGEFTHAHNAMVQFLVVGGLVTTAVVALLLVLTWRRSMALATAGFPAAALFLVAFLYVSWLEASHVPTTLAGHATWLPLMVIARLGLPAGGAPPAPAGADRGGRSRAGAAGWLNGTAGALQQRLTKGSPQKTTVSRM
ncbi:O-antigen ligase family protein [Plantactinospora sp. S1510]|uniref:O-antigen ligase family protein n=1 Tax=Plantactinospora alkalitolerans TaxID=2789879 RepID=A0ABS0H029_9ACTN|nr:O-antigen ligase family protein [Plantactinospora alkalitolerans]MBF9131800.1 O-antigen ligase family protein [Plantactinospora alkalitolerans]